MSLAPIGADTGMRFALWRVGMVVGASICRRCFGCGASLGRSVHPPMPGLDHMPRIGLMMPRRRRRQFGVATSSVTARPSAVVVAGLIGIVFCKRRVHLSEPTGRRVRQGCQPKLQSGNHRPAQVPAVQRLGDHAEAGCKGQVVSADAIGALHERADFCRGSGLKPGACLVQQRCFGEEKSLQGATQAGPFGIFRQCEALLAEQQYPLLWLNARVKARAMWFPKRVSICS